MSEERPNRLQHRVWIVFALAIGLPGLLLSFGSLKAIEADQDALDALRRERLENAASETVLLVQEHVAERARGALHALDPGGLVARWVGQGGDPLEVTKALEPLRRGVGHDSGRLSLVRGLFVASLNGRLVYPQPDVARTERNDLARWFEGRGAAPERLKEAVERFEARAELERRLEQAVTWESRGETDREAARSVYLRTALEVGDPEIAARARLALARSHMAEGDLAAALSHLDLLGRVDPSLRTAAGLSIAFSSRLRAAQIRLRTGATTSGLEGLRDLLGALLAPGGVLGTEERRAAMARIEETLAEAGEVAEDRLAVARRERARWEQERSYAAELGGGVVPDVVAAARASAPPPGDIALVTTARRGLRLIAYRLLETAPARGREDEAGAAETLVLGVDLSLEVVVREVVAPWLDRIGGERAVHLEVLNARGDVLAEGGVVAADQGGAPFAEVRLEGLLPLWTIRAELAADDPNLTRGSFRVALQIGMVVVLLAAMLLGAWWTFRALRRTLELAELKSEFIANVSHELRTPLTSIRMFTDMLLEGRARTEERRQRYLGTVAREASRLSTLIDGILAFARVETGRDVYRFEVGSVAEVARRALDEVRARLDHEGFDVEVDLPEDLPPVRFDEEAIRAALGNLLGNAIKYAALDSKAVRLSAERESGGVRLQVADKGLGIAPEEQARLFEKFYRGREAHDLGLPGSGLGLALVKEVAEAHGGRVWVHSVQGEGAVFAIWLPAE